MDDPLAELSVRFKAEAAERSEAIAGLLERLETGETGLDEEIREHAHKIKGAAGIFGFDQLKERAALLEDAAAVGGGDELRRTWAAMAEVLPD